MPLVTHTLPEYSDIVIVGGGLIGTFLALKLAQGPHTVFLVEAQARIEEDPRALAISWGSAQALQQVGIACSVLTTTAINRVQVSQTASIGRILFQAQELHVPALGYVLCYTELLQFLMGKLAQSAIPYALGVSVDNVQFLSRYVQLSLQIGAHQHAMTTRLVIVADGGKLATQLHLPAYLKTYNQCALVTTVRPATFHQHIAYEHLTPQGPIALLPYQENFALVWIQKPEQAKANLALDEPAFLSTLQQQCKRCTSAFIQAGPRYNFPLFSRILKANIASHTVFIGNAAQTLHPAAAQGFNLGVRDALTLSRLIENTTQADLGSLPMLKSYQRHRAVDRLFTSTFTDLLAEHFDDKSHVPRPVRSLGLMLLEQNNWIKQQLANTMIHGYANPPLID